MEIQWSLVLFTALTGMGGCMFACVAVDEFLGRAKAAAFPAAVAALVIAVVGGLASVTHLSHPSRIMGALSHPTSGIFTEALLVGCLLANILGGCTIFDIVFGSLATLLAALCTRRLREKFWLAALMPVLFNGVIVGAVVHFCYSPAIALPLCMLSVAAGEAVACLVVGPLLIGVLRRVPASVLN